MKNVNFEINIDKLKALVNEIFIKTSGLNRDGRKYERMRESAFAIGERATDMFSPEIECCYTEDVVLEGHRAVIDGIDFKCHGFEQISPETVTGAYVYAVKTGNFALPDEAVIDQLYADIWGTAYTDAVRLLMKEEIEKTHRLSDSFGPGFYGMDVIENFCISKLIDFQRLGIDLKDNGIMVPLKSCTGIYFTVTEDYKPLDAACVDCHGTHSSCRLCQSCHRKDQN